MEFKQWHAFSEEQHCSFMIYDLSTLIIFLYTVSEPGPKFD